MMQLAGQSANTIHVARQPILDQAGGVFGYELLYRGAATDTACAAEGDVASARVFADTVLSLGLDTLTVGRLAFVNLTRSMLVNDAGMLLPPAATVLELREDIAIDGEVIDACRRLHTAGHTLALDDFVAGSDAEVLLPYSKFVKVDVLATPPGDWAGLAARLKPQHVRMIAEKVETAAVVKEAHAAGYHLFQGYFFCKPTTFSSSAIPGRQLVYLNLLSALSRPDLTVRQLEDLVKHDVSLTYRVIRCVNSAAFGQRREIQSIRQALVMMGIGQIRKWASVWALAGFNTGGTSETVTVALLRARSCELVGEKLLGGDASSYFLLGLCSLLDVMLCRPMRTVLEEMPLPMGIRNALLGEPNSERSILDMVIAYQSGDFDAAEATARRTGLQAAMLPEVYTDALRWARELSVNSLAA
jgi:EAL and modified HD-GYP domain-containing signal transduction protein